jgi:hypothetical protein
MTLLRLTGKVSWFGGPNDMGVSPDEGLAFIYSVETAPHLFLPYQPEGTSGLARRLDPNVPFLAMRWDYGVFPKDMLASMDFVALVHAPATGRQFMAWPADWGPHEDTGRVADISKGLLDYLGIETDEEVEVIFPFHISPETSEEIA